MNKYLISIIEAARAGEQGRGFAVVADEVRKLAEQTSRSTETIGDVISGICSGTAEAIQMIEKAVAKVHQSEELAGIAGNAIAEISRGAGTVLSGVSDIATSVNEQSQASREIADKVEKIVQMTEENSISLMQVDKTAKVLETLSESLKKLTNSFKI